MHVDTASLRWSCLEGCRKGGQSLLAFLNGGQFPIAGTGRLHAALQNAAELASPPSSCVPELTPEDEARAVEEEQGASLQETFFLLAHLALCGDETPSGLPCRDAARSWLLGLGFDPARLGDLPIGLFVDRDLVRQRLLGAGFTPEQIDASALADDPRLAGRLVGPIRDRWGRILSFWARHPEGQSPRFLFKGRWKEEAGLFGLDVALHPASAGLGDLIVVERILDAILLHSRGLRRVAAIGGPPGDLDKRRWQRLAALGLRRLVLAWGRLEDVSVATAPDAAQPLRAPKGRPVEVCSIHHCEATACFCFD